MSLEERDACRDHCHASAPATTEGHIAWDEPLLPSSLLRCFKSLPNERAP